MDAMTARAINVDDVGIGIEHRPWARGEWPILVSLLNLHGRELRGMDTSLDVDAYERLAKEGRLLIIGARVLPDHRGIGYCSHIWYDELHFRRRVAMDDAWFVHPDWRGRGIGRRLLERAHEELKKLGCQTVLARTKVLHPHHHTLEELGYTRYEVVHRKEL